MKYTLLSSIYSVMRKKTSASLSYGMMYDVTWISFKKWLVFFLD